MGGTQDPSNPARTWALRVLLTVPLLCVGVAFAVDGPSEAELAPEFPLDEYPGFGSTPAGALRDETIGLWEYFRHEQYVADCMEESGFAYLPEVVYVSPWADAVAVNVGVAPSNDGALPAPDRNDDIRSALTRDQLNRYYLALNGETLAAIESVGPHGETPHEPFAEGGCIGEAERELDSVWKVRRALWPDFQHSRSENLGRGVFAEPEVEVTLRFVAAHEQTLEDWKAQYSSVMSEIRKDARFKAHLAHGIGRSRA